MRLTQRLNTLSRASGNRTHTERFKRPPCCLLHHNPEWMVGCYVYFASFLRSCSFCQLTTNDCQLSSVVTLRIELSTPWLSAKDERPALDYLVVSRRRRGVVDPTPRRRHGATSRVPRSRTEILRFPKPACFHLHLYPMSSDAVRECIASIVSPLSK